jgi:hypothetical protein
MRTLTVHTADELVERWKRRAMDREAVAARVIIGNGDYEMGEAQAYRCAAAELMALLAASMEMEATHHGDPEPVDWSSYPEPEDPNGILEWLLGQRP